MNSSASSLRSCLKPSASAASNSLARRNLADADGGSLPRRLDEDRQSELALRDRRRPADCAWWMVTDRAVGSPASLSSRLAMSLSSAVRRTEDAAAGKRHAGDFGEPLHRAVLAMQAMQDRKEDIDLRQFVGCATQPESRSSVRARPARGRPRSRSPASPACRPRTCSAARAPRG